MTYSMEIPADQKAKVPKELKVYQFVKKNATEQDLKAIAKEFKMDGNVEFDGKQKQYRLKNGNKRLELDQENGTWSYGDYSKLYMSKNTNIPADDEAARIATNFLTEKGWLPADFRLQSVESLTEQADPSIPATVIGKIAYFYRYVDDHPVLGVSRIIVHIGGDGEIVGVKKFFKDTESVGQMALKTVDEAVTEVKDHKASLSTDNPKVKTAAIQSVELAYWEDPGSVSEQTHLQPVYVFKAKGTEGSTDSFSAIVPALKGGTLKKEAPSVVQSFGPKIK